MQSSLVRTWGREAVTLKAQGPGDPQAACMCWMARGWIKALWSPQTTCLLLPALRQLGGQDSPPGETRDQETSGGSLWRPSGQDSQQPSLWIPRHPSNGHPSSFQNANPAHSRPFMGSIGSLLRAGETPGWFQSLKILHPNPPVHTGKTGLTKRSAGLLPRPRLRQESRKAGGI